MTAGASGLLCFYFLHIDILFSMKSVGFTHHSLSMLRVDSLEFILTTDNVRVFSDIYFRIKHPLSIVMLHRVRFYIEPDDV